MFDRLTDHARQVVVEAQQEARALDHDYVGSEHLLLGVLAVHDGVGARALDALGLSLERGRAQVVRTVGRGEHCSPEAIPFTPRAKRVITRAGDQALSAGDDHLGTEHLLLAIVHEPEAVAAGILRDLAVLDRVVGAVAVTPSATEARTAGHGSHGTAARPGGRVTSVEMIPETFDSAAALAREFGFPVVEPTWWPADTEAISHRLYGSPGARHYQIGSTRRDGIPIAVIGHLEAALGGRSPKDRLFGEWSEPAALAHVRGQIGRVGVPRRLQAAIFDHQWQVQLIGYDTEAEIIRTVGSLQLVDPG